MTQQLSNVNAKVEQLETTLHAPQDGLVSTVTSTLSAHAKISQKAAQQAALVQALSSLKSAHVALARAESLLQNGQLDQVVKTWQETEQAVRGPAVGEWIRETHYWQSASQWLDELQRQTKKRLHAAADACIQLSFPTTTISSGTSGNLSFEAIACTHDQSQRQPVRLRLYRYQMSCLRCLRCRFSNLTYYN